MVTPLRALRPAFFLFALWQAHADGREPEWISRVPEGCRYRYFTGSGRHADSDSAQARAMGVALSRMARNAGAWLQDTLSLIKEEYRSGDRDSLLVKYREVFRMAGVPVQAKGIAVEEEYHAIRSDAGIREHYAAVLLRRPATLEDGAGDCESERLPQALLRSACVPGWGQFYLGRRTKGHLIMDAFLLSGAATGITLFFSWHYHDLAKSAATRREAERFNRLSEGNYRWSMVSLALGGAIYAYNLADLFVSGRGKEYAARMRNTVPVITIAIAPSAPALGIAYPF